MFILLVGKSGYGYIQNVGIPNIPLINNIKIIHANGEMGKSKIGYTQIDIIHIVGQKLNNQDNIIYISF